MVMQPDAQQIPTHSTNGTPHGSGSGAPCPSGQKEWCSSQDRDSVFRLCERSIRELVGDGTIAGYEKSPDEPCTLLLYTPQQHLCKVIIDDDPCLHIALIGYRIDLFPANVKHTSPVIVRLGDFPWIRHALELQIRVGCMARFLRETK